MIDVVYYLFNLLGISSQPGRLMLPKWVKISKKRFNEILSIVTKAKNNRFSTNVDGREVTLDNAESLLKDLGNRKKAIWTDNKYFITLINNTRHNKYGIFIY